MKKRREPREYDYFAAMDEFAAAADRAGGELLAASERQDAAPGAVRELRELQNALLQKELELKKRLFREFLTPFEREDLAALACSMLAVVTDAAAAAEKLLETRGEALRARTFELAKQAAGCGKLLVCACSHLRKRGEYPAAMQAAAKIRAIALAADRGLQQGEEPRQAPVLLYMRRCLCSFAAAAEAVDLAILKNC